MNKKYFTLPFVFLYSLIIAGLDTFIGKKSQQGAFNFETFSMRALVVFAYWLIIRLVAENAQRRGKSYKAFMLGSAILIPIIALSFSLLVA